MLSFSHLFLTLNHYRFCKMFRYSPSSIFLKHELGSIQLLVSSNILWSPLTSHRCLVSYLFYFQMPKPLCCIQATLLHLFLVFIDMILNSKIPIPLSLLHRSHLSASSACLNKKLPISCLTPITFI